LTDLENILKPVGFYRQKAKYVRDAACYIEKWGVPKTTKELTQVPGIGPKCAAIVRAFGWEFPILPLIPMSNAYQKGLGGQRKKMTTFRLRQNLKHFCPSTNGFT